MNMQASDRDQRDTASFSDVVFVTAIGCDDVLKILAKLQKLKSSTFYYDLLIFVHIIHKRLCYGRETARRACQ